MGLLMKPEWLHRKKIKILLVQITNKNFGDSVIADNTRFLLKKATKYAWWKKYEILDYAINTEDLAQIRYVDAIVFAGGGLIKFRQENLYRQVSQIIMEAQKHEVPVFLNCVGVEGYDEQDPRCLQLVEAINQPCVKMITVRDDIACLKEHYIENERIRVREVFDPALYSEETYKTIKCDLDETIGLGIAREDLYKDYGITSIDRNYLIKFWKDVISLLEQKGYRWEIFTNGLDTDEAFAQIILDEVGHGKKIRQPFNARELISQIRRMSGMIACRMHSNIIAYSLGIPSIGLVWNEKMTFWGTKCGYPERYIPYTKLEARTVVEALVSALQEGSRKPSWKMKQRTYREIRFFVRKYIRHRRKTEILQLNIDKHLVATALGGYEYRYKNLNSIPQMYQSVAQGYQYVEVDVRMSADEQLLCINGWGSATKKALGLAVSDEILEAGKVLETRYYQYFPTCTFVQLVQAFSKFQQESNLKMILDVGKPKTEQLDFFYKQLTAILRQYQIDEKRIIIRLQRERDVKAFAKQQYACKKCYYIPEEAATQEDGGEKYGKIIRFCKKNKIRMISMTNQTWTEALQRQLKADGFQTLILSYTKVGEIIEALQNGADLVASHYYGVDYLNMLL